MPRARVEVVVVREFEPLRVMTTQLEYYSAQHRSAQIERLEGDPSGSMCSCICTSTRLGATSRTRRGKGATVCGDFNLKPEDPLRKMLDGGFADAWQALNPGKPHPHSSSSTRKRRRRTAATSRS